MCGVIIFCSSNFHVAHGFSHVGFSAGTVAFVNDMMMMVMMMITIAMTITSYL